MDTKKYVLFLVEGKNDKTEIQAMLRAYCSDYFQDRYVDTYVPYNGDITFDVPEKKIAGKVTLSDSTFHCSKCSNNNYLQAFLL